MSCQQNSCSLKKVPKLFIFLQLLFAFLSATTLKSICWHTYIYKGYTLYADYNNKAFGEHYEDVTMIAKLGLDLCLLISAVNRCVNATFGTTLPSKKRIELLFVATSRQDHTVKRMDIMITCDDHGHGFPGAYDAELYTSMQIYETDIIREAILDGMLYGQYGLPRDG